MINLIRHFKYTIQLICVNYGIIYDFTNLWVLNERRDTIDIFLMLLLSRASLPSLVKAYLVI